METHQNPNQQHQPADMITTTLTRRPKESNFVLLSLTSTISSTTLPASKVPSTTPQPPGPSLSTPPPSPQNQKPERSVVDDIDQEIENRKRGRGSSNPWLRFKLSPTEYKHWQKRHQFVEYKFRYDYFPSASLFVLRMPTSLHEVLARKIDDEIGKQLRRIASRPGPTAKFAENILSLGSTTLIFDDDFGKHDPDASFGLLGAQYPGVIIEVSYSQKRKDLPRLADDYILGSVGRIRAVVGVDVKYGGKRATLSIWRPGIVNDTGEEVLMVHEVLSDEVVMVFSLMQHMLTSPRNFAATMGHLPKAHKVVFGSDSTILYWQPTPKRKSILARKFSSPLKSYSNTSARRSDMSR
jgi:hypothetical protein